MVKGWLGQDASLLGGQPAQTPIHAPFVTTPPEVVEQMLRLAGVRRGDVLYDLGSGDGRIPIAAAKRYRVRAVGIEINPERVKEARENARRAGVDKLVSFRQENLLDADIREATVVTLYLLPALNLDVRPKLLADLRPGARVVSHCFDMGDWKPIKTAGGPSCPIYLWFTPGRRTVDRLLP
jgi:SAM-dependent methyltransferase